MADEDVAEQAAGLSRAAYLYAQGQEREKRTVNLLIAENKGSLSQTLFPLFRGSLPWVWIGIRIPKRSLLGELAPPIMDYGEDIDILGAGLTPRSEEEFQRMVAEEREERPDAHPSWHVQLASLRLREAGGIRWPPDTSHIGAAEVKVSYVNEELQVKATGSHDRARTQALNLCKLGFDRVALLRMCVGAPVWFAGVLPWFGAGHVSALGLEGVENALKRPDDDRGPTDPFATVVVSSAAVPGKTETEAGSMSMPRGPQQFCDNPLRTENEPRRKAIESRLMDVMSTYPAPRMNPVFLLACSDASCGHLYVSEGSHEVPCQKCGKHPR